MLDLDFAAAAVHAPTAADFHLIGATPDDIVALNRALEYLNNSPHAQQTLQDAVQDTNLKISIIHNGEDMFSPSTDTVYWDPRSALITLSGAIQSAALGLLHELAHRDAPAGQVKAPDPQYDDTEEKRVITGTESAVAIDLGEPTRSTHDSLGDVDEDDPTYHDDPQSPPPVDSDLPGLSLGDRAGDEEDDDPSEFGYYWGGWTESFHGFNYDYREVSGL